MAVKKEGPTETLPKKTPNPGEIPGFDPFPPPPGGPPGPKRGFPNPPQKPLIDGGKTQPPFPQKTLMISILPKKPEAFLGGRNSDYPKFPLPIFSGPRHSKTSAENIPKGSRKDTSSGRGVYPFMGPPPNEMKTPGPPDPPPGGNKKAPRGTRGEKAQTRGWLSPGGNPRETRGAKENPPGRQV